jgi:hypothetical protein
MEFYPSRLPRVFGDPGLFFKADVQEGTGELFPLLG